MAYVTSVFPGLTFHSPISQEFWTDFSTNLRKTNWGFYIQNNVLYWKSDLVPFSLLSYILYWMTQGLIGNCMPLADVIIAKNMYIYRWLLKTITLYFHSAASAIIRVIHLPWQSGSIHYVWITFWWSISTLLPRHLGLHLEQHLLHLTQLSFLLF